MSQLFPDMPVPASVGGPSAPNDGHGPSTGVAVGLDQALLAFFQSYRPGELGTNQISPNLQLTLPISLWDWSSYYHRLTSPSITAASSVTVPVLTVPQDERWEVTSLRVERGSGDNTLNGVDWVFPAGYFFGSSQSRFVVLSTAAPTIFWPDPGGQQTWDEYERDPFLLEPGSVLELAPSGAGVAASTFIVKLNCRRTKLIRSIPPPRVY